MARRLLENRYAKPSIVAKPKSPVRRPIHASHLFMAKKSAP
jgi:hypothetical protein